MGFFDRVGAWMGFQGAGSGPNSSQAFIRDAGGSKLPSHNLSNVIFPKSYEQAKVDLSTWVEAKSEAEQAGWPFRVTMQKLYEKTRLNAHVAACMQRRKELTLLRDFEIVDSNGNKLEEWTEYFEKAWFKQQMLGMILDATYYGYSLISIGEIVDNVPDKLVCVKRWNISPDRKHVSIYEKSPNGYSWDSNEYEPWHIWVPTLQENGINGCGYGLLYIVSALEILQRNNVQYNTDFIEMFAQPYRVLKTNDTDEEEMAKKQAAMRDMGHNGYMITGLTDELSFLNDGSRGNGYKAYNDFDHRAKSDISKWIGGHANFVDSTTEPLAGGSQNSGGGDATRDTMGNTQVAKAMNAKRMIDGDFVTNIVNESVIPKLRNLGVRLPQGAKIHFLNDTEERAIAAQEADKNQKIATLGLTMAQAGLQMDPAQFTDMTGIKCSRIEVMPDKNVIRDPKMQAQGKDPIKNDNMKRDNTPKKTQAIAAIKR